MADMYVKVETTNAQVFILSNINCSRISSLIVCFMADLWVKLEATVFSGTAAAFERGADHCFHIFCRFYP
jgi:hypothetical protein